MSIESIKEQIALIKAASHSQPRYPKSLKKAIGLDSFKSAYSLREYASVIGISQSFLSKCRKISVQDDAVNQSVQREASGAGGRPTATSPQGAQFLPYDIPTPVASENRIQEEIVFEANGYKVKLCSNAGNLPAYFFDILSKYGRQSN